MNLSDYKLASPEIPKISTEQFKALSKQGQEKYLELYRTQIIPKLSLLREHHRFYLIHGGRGSGKSTSVAKWLLQKMTAEPHTLLCTREIQNSLAESSYQLLADMIEYQQLKGWTVQKEKIYHENGSKIIFHGLRDTQASNSLKSVVNISLVWVEEAQAISKNSLRLLLPTIRVEGAEFYFTYNPETPDDAVELMKTRKDVCEIEVNWYDNPFFPKQLFSELEADLELDEDECLHVWFGQYRKQGDNCIMSRSGVLEAMCRKADEEGAVSIGVDVARYGDDRTTMFKRKGLQVADHKVYKKCSLSEQADYFELFCNRDKGVHACIDGGGVGGGLIDILRERGYRDITEVNFGEKAMDTDKYDSAVSELWFTFPLSEAGLPDIPELLTELTDRRYKFNSKGQKVVESKDEYKKRHSGKSPDLADGLLLCFYNKHINRPMLY